MKDVKTAFEIIHKKSASDREKLNDAKGATQEAAQLARDRLEEINIMKSHLKDEKEKVATANSASLDIKNQGISLQEVLNERAKMTEKELQLMIDGHEKLITEYQNETKNIQKKFEIEKSKNEQLNEEMVITKKEHRHVLRENVFLKKEVQNIADKFQSMKVKNQIRENVCNNMLRHKQSKKIYKKQIKQLTCVIHELNQDLQSKQSTISSLTIDMQRIKSKFEQVQHKFNVDNEYCLFQMKNKYEKELVFYKDKVCELDAYAKKVIFEKKLTEKKAILLAGEIKAERKVKLLVEKKFKTVQQSLEEQTKKAKETLHTVSDDFSSD